MKKRRIKKKIIAEFIIIICLIGIIYSSYNIIKWKKSIDDNSDVKKQIDDNINIIENEETKKDEYKIDFDNFKKQNNDVIAYLKVSGTNIDYLVVKGKDNSFYLNHNFNKEKNVAGWIFADYRNKFDESDKNIIIYGHNTRDGSMFGTLKNILKNDWHSNDENLIIDLVTEKNTYRYQVFSTYIVEPEEYYLTTSFTDAENFNKFINKLKSRSNYDYKIDVNSEDKILTLSSCIANGKKRVVLHAKLIDDKVD